MAKGYSFSLQEGDLEDKSVEATKGLWCRQDPPAVAAVAELRKVLRLFPCG